MKKLLFISSVLALFFIGCSGSKNCEDYGTIVKCGMPTQNVSEAVMKCNALPEAQQAKLFSCYKSEEAKYCDAFKKVLNADQTAAATITEVKTKCDAETKK